MNLGAKLLVDKQTLQLIRDGTPLYITKTGEVVLERTENVIGVLVAIDEDYEIEQHESLYKIRVFFQEVK